MLDINNHINKKMTGPNTTIQSLDFVLKNYSKFKKKVIMNKKNFMKKFSKFLIYPNKNQPNIGPIKVNINTLFNVVAVISGTNFLRASMNCSLEMFPLK